MPRCGQLQSTAATVMTASLVALSDVESAFTTEIVGDVDERAPSLNVGMGRIEGHQGVLARTKGIGRSCSSNAASQSGSSLRRPVQTVPSCCCSDARSSQDLGLARPWRAAMRVSVSMANGPEQDVVLGRREHSIWPGRSEQRSSRPHHAGGECFWAVDKRLTSLWAWFVSALNSAVFATLFFALAALVATWKAMMAWMLIRTRELKASKEEQLEPKWIL